MTNPDRTVHCSEAVLAIVCCLILLAVVCACSALVLDAYR